MTMVWNDFRIYLPPVMMNFVGATAHVVSIATKSPSDPREVIIDEGPRCSQIRTVAGGPVSAVLRENCTVWMSGWNGHECERTWKTYSSGISRKPMSVAQCPGPTQLRYFY